MQSVETKKNEVREITSDIRQMKGKYLVYDLKRSWKEDFVDKGSGEVVSIERKEMIYERGTLLQAEELSRIQFFMSEGSISEVEVSNQKRMSYEFKNRHIYPYMAQVDVEDKKRKFLMLASSVDNALEIVKDFVELNYIGRYQVSMVKEYENHIIIVDTMLKKPLDDVTRLALDEELYSREERDQILKGDDENKPDTLKFYKIKARVSYSDEDNKDEIFQSFIVNTYTAERAIMLINDFLNREQNKHEKELVDKGNTFKRKDINAVIEESGVIPVYAFVPKEFSEAYQGQT
ncbi:RNA polymerase subunit sigma [Phocaeicola dorei]|jgi:hypothetical protein|uniref:RNA polymerase subunit sigma n=1 Tax=Phocaeicola dorei TaxID=357276 RepID=UPI0039B6DB3C